MDADTLIEAPRANANEDQLQVIDVAVSDGSVVAAGDLLFVLETTKAAVEITAPGPGIVSDVAARVGDFVDVGSTLCRISGGPVAKLSPASVVPVVEEVAVTAKARRVAQELGIDIAALAGSGRIGEAEVRAAHAARTSVAAPAGRRWGSGSRRAVIVGGGGHAACLIDALQGAGYDLIGCVDRVLPAGTQVAAGVTVLGDEGLLDAMRADGIGIAFIGIGGADNSRTRTALFDRVSGLGFDIPAIIHPRAIVSSDVVIGRGCHVLAGASIGPRCHVGDNVIVNQGSIVCHDSRIADHAHIAPGAILAGNVRIGRGSVVGMGATLLLGITVGADCLVHNGTNLSADVPAGTVVDSSGRRTPR